MTTSIQSYELSFENCIYLQRQHYTDHLWSIGILYDLIMNSDNCFVLLLQDR